MKTSLSLIACFCAVNLPAQVRLLSGIDSSVEARVSSTLQMIDQSHFWINALLIAAGLGWGVFLCSVVVKSLNLDKGASQSN